jgi:hypothetical protein
MVSKKPVSPLVPYLLAGLAACAGPRHFVADNLYEEPAPRAPVGIAVDQVFSRAPWQLRHAAQHRERFLPEARLMLPDIAESFTLGELFVYAEDGSDIQLVYVSWPVGTPEENRVVIRLSVYRAPTDLEREWSTFDRRWHEMQTGTLVDPLPVPADYPSDTKRKAWTLPVGDGYGAPAFEQMILFHSGGWSVRCQIAAAAEARAAATARILAFLGRLYPGIPATASSQDDAPRVSWGSCLTYLTSRNQPSRSTCRTRTSTTRAMPSAWSSSSR